jgi:hypothetical protein
MVTKQEGNKCQSDAIVNFLMNLWCTSRKIQNLMVKAKKNKEVPFQPEIMAVLLI